MPSSRDFRFCLILDVSTPASTAAPPALRTASPVRRLSTTVAAPASRAELGAWFDNTIPLDRGNVLALRSCAAWAHDHSSNPAMGAVFQTLPGSNFTVNGAQAAADSALLSAAAELRLASRWSIGARLDGEIANGSHTYAGTGSVRYVW